MNYAKANWDDLRFYGLARKTRQLGWNAYTVSNRNETEERSVHGVTLEVTVRKAHIKLGQVSLNENGQDKRIHFPDDDMSPHDIQHDEGNQIILERRAAKQRAKRKRRRFKARTKVAKAA